MTSNRAQKHAARRRAEETGERYVVARRSVEDIPTSTDPLNENGWHPSVLVRVLHDATHKIPGVPAHLEGDALAVRHSARTLARHERGSLRAAKWATLGTESPSSPPCPPTSDTAKLARMDRTHRRTGPTGWTAGTITRRRRPTDGPESDRGERPISAIPRVSGRARRFCPWSPVAQSLPACLAPR
jgi:hypothetical protein